jgi:hypothetical protein
MPVWLWRSIVGVSGTVALMAMLQWASCTFYVMPMTWPWYAKYRGTAVAEKISLPPVGCEDIGARSIAALMGLLTTLISLSRQAEDR